jgi:hypothetical protein
MVSKAKVTPKTKGKTKTSAKVASSTSGRTGNGAKAGKEVRGDRRPQLDITHADATLFDPLTPGEVADALRTLTEDRRLSTMAKVGRYRVICTEPLVIKPSNGPLNWMAGHRLARIVVYDYSADRAVDACVDLDAGVVAHLELSRGQPMLSREEEALAVSVATLDERVRGKLDMGDVPVATCHYWGRTPTDLAYARRSAAVIFGRADGHASLVAVVDLLDHHVTQIVPAERW